MNPAELRALAERVMNATAPDFALGVEVLRALGRNIGDVNPLFSLDAAVSLVPEGWAYSIHGGEHDGGATSYIVPNGGKLPWPAWVDDVDAPTPALALTAAALLARAAMMESNDDR